MAAGPVARGPALDALAMETAREPVQGSDRDPRCCTRQDPIEAVHPLFAVPDDRRENRPSGVPTGRGVGAGETIGCDHEKDK